MGAIDSDKMVCEKAVAPRHRYRARSSGLAAAHLVCKGHLKHLRVGFLAWSVREPARPVDSTSAKRETTSRQAYVQIQVSQQDAM